jgi:hypothetical protein
MRSLRVLAIAVLALLSAPAFAVSFQVTGWDLGETVRVAFNGQAHAFTTVQFHENVDGVIGTSFCADLSQVIGKTTYTNFTGYDPVNAGAQSFAGGKPARQFAFAATIADEWGNGLGWLESELGVTRVQAITGVQAAVWEAVYGDAFSATSSSMSGGAFRVFEYVLGFKAYDGYGSTQLYYSRTNQDQLFTPPVPEPSAMLAFAAGALLVGQTLLRRRQQA